MMSITLTYQNQKYTRMCNVTATADAAFAGR